jgi:hypothetical protein
LDTICFANDGGNACTLKSKALVAFRFILTDHERKTWQSDPDFRLAFVSDALRAPIMSVFDAGQRDREFAFAPLSYVVTRKPNKALQPTRAAQPNGTQDPARSGPRG